MVSEHQTDRRTPSQTRFRQTVLDIDRDIAVDAGMVPALALADPIDRCLVATAREYEVPLMTADRRILDYAANTGLLRIIDASR